MKVFCFLGRIVLSRQKKSWAALPAKKKGFVEGFNHNITELIAEFPRFGCEVSSIFFFFNYCCLIIKG